MYPIARLRRKRKHAWLRDMVAENVIRPEHLIYPLFVIEGHDIREEISTMPGVQRLSIDHIVQVAQEAAALGIKAIALFPSIAQTLKNNDATEAYNPDNLISRTVRTLKKTNINIGIICDVALDPYTSSGHDGIVVDGDIDNDITLEVLCKQALILGQAGADIVAPSDMMDGRIGAIRNMLDDKDYKHVCILSYSAKYASNFYGPFRDAVVRTTTGISKTTYQMDFRNAYEAIRAVEFDINEGADMVMIKPGMPYLDVLRDVALHVAVPVFAYQVSGEYSMLKYASLAGCFDFEAAMMESLMSFRRAGATGIFTYAALEIARKLHNTQ